MVKTLINQNLNIKKCLYWHFLYAWKFTLKYSIINLMSAKITNIAKNTSYFTFALILQKVISFAYFVILARYLFPEDLGKYYLAISLTTIFAVFIDLGLANVLTREVAKTQEKASKLIGSVLIIKTPLALISFLSLFLFVNIMNYSSLVRTLVYISSISMILDSFTLAFYASIRGFHKLKFESIGVILFQLIVLVFGLLALGLNLGLNYLVGALALASIFNFIYSGSLIRLKLKMNFNFHLDKILIKSIIAIAVPFALFGIFQRLYMYLDTVFLSYLAGDKYVGLYQVAFKIIFALQFLPMAFMASLYPAFASYFQKNKEQLAMSFERAVNYLIIISLPVSIGIITMADKIILVFKPEYIEAVLPLQIIMLALPFIFINFPIGSLLNACDKQQINTKNIFFTLIASIILNLILIPRYQVVGASITVVATNIFMFILGILEAPKIVKYRPNKILSIFFRSLLSVAFMAVSVLFLKQFLNIFLTIILAGVLYFLLLFLLKGVKREDIYSILKSFAKEQKNE